MAIVVSGSNDDEPTRNARRPQPGDHEAGRADEGAAAAPSRLDLKTINGTALPAGKALVIQGNRCRSWMCPRCGPGYWAKVGDRVTPYYRLFRKARLLTLTIDRKRFESGEDAYLFIQSRGLIRRFLRLLGFKKAFGIFAFHPQAPDWPHWHLVVDLADAGNWVDLKRAWRLWRDTWGCGGFDLGANPHCRNVAAAVRYAVGYCQHQAGVVPDWVKNRDRAPRAYEFYGELRKQMREDNAAQQASIDEPAPEADEQTEADTSSDESGGTSRRRATRPIRERLGDCDQGSTVLLCRTSPLGRPSYQFMGTLAIRPALFALAHAFGDERAINVETGQRTLSNGTSLLDVWIPVQDENPKDLFERLEREGRRLIAAYHSGRDGEGDGQ